MTGMIGEGVPQKETLAVNLALLGVDITCTAMRIEHQKPLDFRLAIYPDGRRLVQAAYLWEEGVKRGITWKALPAVLVDESGRELAMQPEVLE